MTDDIDADRQDLEHLKLLSIFHYIAAGLMALFACLPLIHLTLGLVFLSGIPAGREQGGGEIDARALGFIFVLVAGVLILLGWTVALLVFFAGRRLAQRRSHTYCLVIAGLECLFMPLGTILGVFTIVVLSRDGVKELFDQPPRLPEYRR